MYRERCQQSHEEETSNIASDMPLRLCCAAGYRTQLLSWSDGHQAAVAVTQPRRAVIDRAWRAIGPGVEVLSGDDGGPLRRTVKRIIDPLVLRLRSNTQYSAPFVAIRRRRGDARRDRRARAPSARRRRVVRLLKRERRRLRITTGNAQELYFPVCFELAVTKGAPAQAGSRRRRSGAARDPRRPGPHRDRGAEPVRVRSAGHREALGSARPQLARRHGPGRDHRTVPGRPDHGARDPPTATAPRRRASGSGRR